VISCPRNTARLVVAAALGLFALSGAASAQSTPTTVKQTLDRVFVYTAGAVLDMAVGNAARPPDFTSLGLTATALTNCTLTVGSGLYCLDGKAVRNWPNPMDPTASASLLYCDDPVLNLDSRKGPACTALAVDAQGAVWLAGRKSYSHSVIKAVKRVAATCEVGWKALSRTAWCTKEFYAGRPPLVDLVLVEGDAAAGFRACPTCVPQTGLIGIEERKNTVFYPAPANNLPTQPINIASSRDWTLSSKEQLQDVTVLQLGTAASPQNFVLVSTSSGRVLAKSTDTAGYARLVYNAPAARAAALTSLASRNSTPAPPSCTTSTYETWEHERSSGSQQYGLRGSPTSGAVYLTDRSNCEVLPLKPTGSPFVLARVQQGGVDVVLSTADETGDFPPLGVTVAAGLSIDLRSCTLNCAIINNDQGQPAAQLSALQLASGSSFGATVFQIRNIPDCRYAYATGFPADQKALCIATPGVVVKPNGTPDTLDSTGRSLSGYAAAALYLNVTPLLPRDAVAAFSPATLPSLLISRQYRGQSRNNFTFQGLFVVTQPGVKFTDVFGGEFDVPGLEGSTSSLGCIANPSNLLAWDVATTVSEVYVSVGGRYVDTLTNVGCGTIKTAGSRLSLLPYDLEIAPDTYDPSRNTVKYNDPAVFGKLLQALYGDLGTVQRDLACKQVDPVPAGGTPPLPSSTCSTLAYHWSAGKSRLDQCVAEAFNSRYDDCDNDCAAFIAALNRFEAQLPTTTPTHDVANRVGELKMRIQVLRHVYTTRFLPSIPPRDYHHDHD
jgi:hypothetical protein